MHRSVSSMLCRSLLPVLLALFVTPAPGQPADADSKIIARYGDWDVVAKQARFQIVETGRRGTYTICSAMFFGAGATLEFEVKNDVAWGVYVARRGWTFAMHRAPLTIRSGSVSIQLPTAVYAGPMISAASHDLSTSRRVPLTKLHQLARQNRPITVLDARGMHLVSFPNAHGDLVRALGRAGQCWAVAQKQLGLSK